MKENLDTLARLVLQRAEDVVMEEQPLRQLLGADAERSKRLWPLGELLDQPERLLAPVPLVSDLAWRGKVTLLSAREKTGKSTLLGQAVAAVSAGRRFLDVEHEELVVLWYCIDEALEDAVRRFREHGADRNRVILSDSVPSADQIRADVLTTNAQLIVIDTLTALMSRCIDSDKDAFEVSRFLAPFIAVARELGVAMVLVHHTTKLGREYRGSVQLGAAVDVVLTLHVAGGGAGRDDESEEFADDDGQRRLRGKGRAGISVDRRLVFEDGEYHAQGQPPTMNERVLEAVQLGARSKNQIVDRVGGKRQSVLRCVDLLLAAGELRMDGSKILIQSIRVPTMDTSPSSEELAQSTSPRATAGLSLAKGVVKRESGRPVSPVRRQFLDSGKVVPGRKSSEYSGNQSSERDESHDESEDRASVTHDAQEQPERESRDTHSKEFREERGDDRKPVPESCADCAVENHRPPSSRRVEEL